MALAAHALISPIGSDLLAFAQCCAIDATAFPHTSLPFDATRSVFVVRDCIGGPVAGFVATRRTMTHLEIVGLAVDTSQRGRGFGTALLEHACREASARGLRGVSLHVAVSNVSAIRLYRSAGFHVARRLRGFYRSGDAYEMTKTLRP